MGPHPLNLINPLILVSLPNKEAMGVAVLTDSTEHNLLGRNKLSFFLDLLP